MTLRLAGEEFGVVQGLDGQGRLREIAVNDGSPGLQVKQSGAAPVLKAVAAGGEYFLGCYSLTGTEQGYIRQASGGLEIASGTGHTLRLMPGSGGVVVGGPLEWGASHSELTEMADPAAPAADKARLYARDNGSGKTQLVVRFPTGAVQVLATEP